MFWLIVGLVLGAAFYWLATRANFKMTWYEWVLLVLGVILLLFSIQNYAGSQQAFEPRAAGLLLLMFGLPGLILAALGVGLPFFRGRKAA